MEGRVDDTDARHQKEREEGEVEERSLHPSPSSSFSPAVPRREAARGRGGEKAAHRFPCLRLSQRKRTSTREKEETSPEDPPTTGDHPLQEAAVWRRKNGRKDDARLLSTTTDDGVPPLRLRKKERRKERTKEALDEGEEG